MELVPCTDHGKRNKFRSTPIPIPGKRFLRVSQPYHQAYGKCVCILLDACLRDSIMQGGHDGNENEVGRTERTQPHKAQSLHQRRVIYDRITIPLITPDLIDRLLDTVCARVQLEIESETP